MPNTTGVMWQVILNPHAGGGKGAHDQKRIEQLLKNSGIQYNLSVSQFAGHAIELTRNIINQGVTHLIVAGGDGTLNEVVNGIFLAEKKNAAGDYSRNATGWHRK